MKINLILKFCTIFYLILSYCSFSFAEVNIVAKINKNIITNYDLKKEISYLLILNNSLKLLKDNEIEEIAKKSLINQIIKKEELIKFTNLSNEKVNIQLFLNRLLANLGIDSLESFNELLKKENSYSLSEIENKIMIEALWNTLIYEKYKNFIKIDNDKIIKRINILENEDIKEFLLSEIIFSKKKGETSEKLFNNIKTSINEIGFKNTATIFSNSESSKLGGLIGWISENNLSNEILIELNKLKKGQISNVIKIENNFIILKIDDIKISKRTINKKAEFDKIVEIEKNRQLAKYSRIYFEKIYMNYSIYDK
jgi:peptidyl-prolyl cis-trans isomerase SurA